MKNFTKIMCLVAIMSAFSFGFAQQAPVTNLSGTFDGLASVELTWTAPTGAESIMTYSSGTCTSAIGYGATTPIDVYVAQRFPAEDLVAYQGLSVTKVKFVPYSQTAAYTVTVWLGDQVGTDEDGYTTYTPTTIAASKAATGFVAEEWTTVTLDSPVAIPATGAMWIGVRCVGNGYVAATDNGPSVIGKGDLIQDGNTFYDLKDMGLNYNFCVMGVASAPSKNVANELHEVVLNGTTGTLEADPTPAEISRGVAFECSYNVYEGASLLGNTILPRYTTPVLSSGTHTYCVTVDYGSGVESTPTCADVVVGTLACGTPTEIRWVDYQEDYGEGVIAIFANSPVGAARTRVVWVDYNNMEVADWDPIQYSGVLFPIPTGDTYCFGVQTACFLDNDTVWSAVSDTVCVYLAVVCQPAEALNGQCTGANTVNLMWGPSANAIAYNIYRDEVAVATNLELEDLVYTDTDVPAGIHSYTVTGVCSDGSESIPTDPKEIVVTSVAENGAEGAVIYPNPAKDQFRVVAEGMNRVVVSTMLGQVVYETVAEGSEVVVPTTDLENGIYMVTVETNDGAATKRISVVR